ncbi:MAG: hypothetical protein JOZ55_09400 [Alphaproteobacteria bacterium]|nr:hypothetical protein [Alphaproteobacteria bacterium]
MAQRDALRVSRAEYESALSFLLDLTAAGSSAGEASRRVLAGIWDSAAPAEARASIALLDAQAKRNAFVALIGRSLFGRPLNHPRRQEIESAWQREYSEGDTDAPD